jgi:hypothetical protein
VGPTTGVDDMEEDKILSPPGHELRRLDDPARRQSLYRLSYIGSQISSTHLLFIFLSICDRIFISCIVTVLPRTNMLVVAYTVV